MTIEFLTILAVIGIFSVVQSFFGMGLLVFGTPTLLMLGYDFTTTLGYLLPASFTISLLQVLTAGDSRVAVSKYLYLFCLPGIVIGLWSTEASPLGSITNILVGVTLLVSALIRFSAPLRAILTTILERFSGLYHLFMGLVHGMTNLGGAFLAVLASGLHSDKESIRYTIAHYYLAFVAMQIVSLLVITGPQVFNLYSLAAAGLAGLIHFLIGNRIFKRASEPAYNFTLTLFLMMYGVAVLLKV